MLLFSWISWISSKNTGWGSQWSIGNFRCNASGVNSGELGWKSERRGINVYRETSDRWNESGQLE